jgi:O-antigen/teichoic acid export membrane protein
MKATFFYLAEKYIPALLSAIFVFYFANIVEVEFFGRLNYFLSIVGILSVFTLGSIDQLLQKELVGQPGKEEDFTNNVISVKLISTSLVLLILFLLSRYIAEQDRVLFAILLTTVLINSFNSVRSVLIANNLYIKQIYISLPAAFISFVVKMALINITDDTNWLAFCFVIDSLLINTFLFIWYKSNYSFRFGIDFDIFCSFWKEGKFLVLSGATLLVYAHIDKVIIGNILTEKVLANYSVAVKLLGIYLMSSSAFNLGFVKLLDPSSADLNKYCKNMLVFSLALGTVFMLINYFLSPIILSYIYGDKYLFAIDYIQFLSPIILLSFLLSSTGRILVTKGLSRYAFKRNIHALWVNVLVSVVCGVYFGVIGVIFGTILSFMVSSVVYIVASSVLRLEFKRIIMS